MKHQKNLPNDVSANDVPLDLSFFHDDETVSPVVLPIVVALGASAGGLEAFEAFFRALPSDSNLAYVVIQHLDPKHASILVELIQHYTPIHVRQAERGMIIEVNTITVIPSNAMMGVFHGRLQLLDGTETTRIRMPIDYFFRSLAQDLSDRVVAIVLSGTGSDGSLGIKAIKEVGGLVMVQDPASAAYDGMPRSAIATGAANLILRPEAMPLHLIDYCKRVFRLTEIQPLVRQQNPMPDAIQQILFMIRAQTDHDFSYYKPSMIRRRIERLMAVNQCDTFEAYARLLQNNPSGIEALFQELLIRVTSFFRDEEAFEELRTLVIPKLFENRSPDQPIRIWIPACSTGEEAYSIAILLREHMKTLNQRYKVQIFATDLDEEAIGIARNGVYMANIMIDLREDLLREYFTLSGEDGYQVTKPLRDMIVFSPHNLTTDPPFSKLDLISCRNILIYLNTRMQEKTLASFHFALLPLGFLFLGTAEGIGRYEDDFHAVSSTHKIFQRPPGPSKLKFEPDVLELSSARRTAQQAVAQPAILDLRTLTESLLLNKWTPTCIITNYEGHIRYVHGHPDRYLEIPPGEIDPLDIIGVAREDLKAPLKAALSQAIHQQQDIFKLSVQFEVSSVKHWTQLSVQLLHDLPNGEELVAVFFEDMKPFMGLDLEHEVAVPAVVEDYEKYRLLVQELNDTRAYLRETIDALEASNEQLQAINEELSTLNEELETSREELRSVNKELFRSNTELEQKIVELTWANSDLTNTMNTMQTGMLLLDSDLRIRRFNPLSTQIFKLIEADIGRSIGDIRSEFDYPLMLEDVEKVFATLVPIEKNVQARNEHQYAVQIRPYRTAQNAIKGVMIYFHEISSPKGI